MTYTDFSFFIFVLVVIGLYFTVFRKRQWILLLIASIAFYLFSGPKYMIFVITTSVVTYSCAGKIQESYDVEREEEDRQVLSREEQKTKTKEFNRKRKVWLWFDFATVIGLLIILKYTNFIFSGISTVLHGFGIDWSREVQLVLPLGISFYTFMAVGYILDIYWGKYRAERNYLRLLLFMIYFPHIIQGPIARYDKLVPQFQISYQFNYERVSKGLQLALWGLFEKMVIADRLAIFANGVYVKWDTVAGIPLLIAITFFSLQLYLDFQGCMDIGHGISQAFGIELEKNFWHPYFSKSMPEFWRRWHITLGAWFKDYLLYPVSMTKLCKRLNQFTRKKWGNQVSRIVSSIIPTSCVWIVTGLWHGAASNYLIWGIYHGVLIILSTIFDIPIKRFTARLRINTESWSFSLFRMLRTFTLSAIGRIFFVSSGFLQALEIIKKTFDFRNLNLYTLWDNSLYSYGLDRRNFMLALFLIVVVWAVSMLQEKMIIRDRIAAQNLIFRWALYYVLIFGIIIFGIYGPGYDAASFVYGQF